MKHLGSTLVFLAAALILLFSILGIFAGVQANSADGVTTVRCDRTARQVFAAIHGKVFILDELGNTQLVLESPDPGSTLKSVHDIDRTKDGDYLVSEAVNHRILQYDANGKFHKVLLEGEDLFRLHFEIIPLDDGAVLIGDGIRHRLIVADKNGRIIKERKCGYPNGLLRWSDNRFLAMCTYNSELLFINKAFEDQAAPDDGVLRKAMTYKHPGTKLHLSADANGFFYYDNCRTYHYGCDILRFDNKEGGPTSIVKMNKISLPATEWTKDGYEVSGFCTTSTGNVIVASDWYSTLLEFSDGKGGPPGTFTDFPGTIDPLSLIRGIDLGVNTHLRFFGDSKVQEEAANLLDMRLGLYNLAVGTRVGTYVLLALILIALALVKLFAGPDVSDLQQRMKDVYQKIIGPDQSNISLYLATLTFAFLVGAALGQIVAGLGSSLLLGLLFSRTVGRKYALSKLIQKRGATIARSSFDIYLGKGAGNGCVLKNDEEVLACSFALPLNHYNKNQIASVLGEDAVDLPNDPYDLLDVLFPSIYLIAVTSHRVIFFPCSLFGRPLGAIWNHPRTNATGFKARGRSGIILGSNRGYVSLMPAGGQEGAAYKEVDSAVTKLFQGGMVVSPAFAICHDCKLALSRRFVCKHYQPSTFWALMLGAFLPGAGHLIVGELTRGRLLLTVFATLLIQFIGIFMFFHYGTLPVSRFELVASAVTLGVFWFFCMTDLGRMIREKKIVLDEL